MNRNCKECEYCNPIKSPIIGTFVGECRRFPPLLIVVPDQGNNAMIMKWPVVQGSKDFYCFEFKKRVRPGDVIEIKPEPSGTALDRLEEAIRRLTDKIADYDRDHPPAA